VRFPDAVTVLRATADEYGNPGTNWDTPATVATTRGFLQHRQIFIPPTVDLRAGDRVATARGTFVVDGEPEMLRSPARNIMWLAKLERVPEVST